MQVSDQSCECKCIRTYNIPQLVAGAPGGLWHTFTLEVAMRLKKLPSFIKVNTLRVSWLPALMSSMMGYKGSDVSGMPAGALSGGNVLQETTAYLRDLEVRSENHEGPGQIKRNTIKAVAPSCTK
eukprot:1155366-Pelagomonas_calceolata.AAC.2